MKTKRQSPHLALLLSATEATQWCRLVFKLKTILKTSVVPSRFRKSTTSVQHSESVVVSLGDSDQFPT